jgi:membrane protein YdbS with pleckstrin-like domain
MATELYEQAVAARTRGDLQGARQLLISLLRTNTDDEQARSALATVCMESGNPAEAVQVLHPLVTKYPQNATLLARYGVALSKAGRHADAIKVLTRAMSIQGSAEVQRDLDEAVRRSEQPVGPPPQVDQPVRKSSLATDLDDVSDGSDRSDQVRGELQQLWHRRTSSYRRFWLGILILMVGAIGAVVKLHNRKAPVSDSLSVSRFLHSTYLGLGLGLVLGVILLITALISARFTRYKLYEHRIDFERGVLSQLRRPVWLFDITSVSLQRPPILTLTHTASIVVEHDTKAGKPSREKLVAICGVAEMTAFVEQLQGSSLRERRAMKKMWI